MESNGDGVFVDTELQLTERKVEEIFFQIAANIDSQLHTTNRSVLNANSQGKELGENRFLTLAQMKL